MHRRGLGAQASIALAVAALLLVVAGFLAWDERGVIVACAADEKAEWACAYARLGLLAPEAPSTEVRLTTPCEVRADSWTNTRIVYKGVINVRRGVVEVVRDGESVHRFEGPDGVGAVANAFSVACSDGANGGWGYRGLPPPLFVGLAALLILFASSWQPYEMAFRQRDDGRIEVVARRLLWPTMTSLVPHDDGADVDVVERGGKWMLVVSGESLIETKWLDHLGASHSEEQARLVQERLADWWGRPAT